MIFNCDVGLNYHMALDPDAPIYRFLKFEDLIDLFANNRLYFRRVDLWADPWENVARKMVFDVNENQVASGFCAAGTKTAGEFYASCWTSQFDTDAMWRIYSGNSEAVCIKTTLRKFFCSTVPFTDIRMDAFVGPVKYIEGRIEESRLKSLYNQMYDEYPDYMIPIFLKRDAFQHEHEIRMAARYLDVNLENGQPAHKLTTDKKGLFWSLQDTEFLEQIILPPQIGERKEQYYREVISKYNDNLEVRRSDLYASPADMKEPEDLDRDHGLPERRSIGTGS